MDIRRTAFKKKEKLGLGLKFKELQGGWKNAAAL
jgi:hypothetical protein